MWGRAGAVFSLLYGKPFLHAGFGTEPSRRLPNCLPWASESRMESFGKTRFLDGTKLPHSDNHPSLWQGRRNDARSQCRDENQHLCWAPEGMNAQPALWCPQHSKSIFTPLLKRTTALFNLNRGVFKEQILMMCLRAGARAGACAPRRGDTHAGCRSQPSP